MRFVCCLFFSTCPSSIHTSQHHQEEKIEREIIDFPNEGCVWVFMGITVRTVLLPLWEKELIYRRFFVQQQLNGKYLAICAAKIYCRFFLLLLACVFVWMSVHTHVWTHYRDSREAIIYRLGKFAADFLCLFLFSQQFFLIYFHLIDSTRNINLWLVINALHHTQALYISHVTKLIT